MAKKEDSRPVKAKFSRPVRSSQWWRANDEKSLLGAKPHDIVETVIRRIRQRQAVRYDMYKRLAQMSGRTDLTGFGLTQSSRELFDDKLAINEAASTLETLHAQVFKNRVVPSPQCVGADYDTQERTREFGRWLDGVFDECAVHSELVPPVGWDSLEGGTGFFLVASEVDDDEGRITVDHLPHCEVGVDEVEARYGKPRSIYVWKLFDRGVLLDKYGKDDETYYGSAKERANAIIGCTESSDEDGVTSDTDSDMLLVKFAWHLPSGKDAGDGACFVGIKNCTLELRPWARMRFPVVKMRGGVPKGGYYGDSALREILPAQIAYDKTNERIDVAHDVIGIPRLIVARGAKIKKGHIDDIVGSIIETEDINGIKEWTPTPIHPEIYNYRDSLTGAMRNRLGISSFSSHAEIPPGLANASGVALERFEDTENARQAMPHRNYETAMTDLAEVIIDEAEELEARGVSVQSRARDKYVVERISFADVKVDRKDFVLRIPPASALPKTPAAKLDKLENLAKTGLIKPATFNRLSEIGDAEAATDMDTSDEDIILKNLNYMVKTGEYLSPESFDNLALIKEIGRKFYNYCRRKGVTQDKLELIATYIDDAVMLIKREAEKEAALAATKAPPPPPPMPMGGPGAPMPPGAPPPDLPPMNGMAA